MVFHLMFLSLVYDVICLSLMSRGSPANFAWGFYAEYIARRSPAKRPLLNKLARRLKRSARFCCTNAISFINAKNVCRGCISALRPSRATQTQSLVRSPCTESHSTVPARARPRRGSANKYFALIAPNAQTTTCTSKVTNAN